jgi:uncharacterized membrane protein YhaH (DUF805 family)
MTFTQAIETGFRRYADFSRRAVRSEFWYWQMFIVLGGLAAELLDFAFALGIGFRGWPLTILFWLGTLIPDFAVTVRRLHDTDRSGWWLLLGLVPLVGMIVLIVWWCTRGGKGYNRFGADPPPPGPRHRLREAQS